MVHGALAIPGRTDSDAVVFTEEEIARTGLDYLPWATGTPPSRDAPERCRTPTPARLNRGRRPGRAGQVLIVTLEDQGGRHVVSIAPKRVGQTRSEKLDLDVGGVKSQPELIDVLGRHADSNLVFDVRLTGLYPDDLDLDMDEVERALAPSFLRLRIRDMSIPASPEGIPPPPETVLGAFVRTSRIGSRSWKEVRLSRSRPVHAPTHPAPSGRARRVFVDRLTRDRFRGGAGQPAGSPATGPPSPRRSPGDAMSGQAVSGVADR